VLPLYNPKEAAEDSHALHLAILFFVASAVAISIYFHHDSGLKYWLLKGFGETTPGKVLVIINDTPDGDKAWAHYRSNYRNTFKNFKSWHDERIVVEINPTNAPAQTLDFRIKSGEIIRETDGALNVTYLPLNPKIAYPTRSLDRFSLDSQILFWSLVAGAVLLFLALRSARKWARFRARLRQY
jgi:hypothetical protein